MLLLRLTQGLSETGLLIDADVEEDGRDLERDGGAVAGQRVLRHWELHLQCLPRSGDPGHGRQSRITLGTHQLEADCGQVLDGDAHVAPHVRLVPVQR